MAETFSGFEGVKDHKEMSTYSIFIFRDGKWYEIDYFGKIEWIEMMTNFLCWKLNDIYTWRNRLEMNVIEIER